MTSMRPQSPTAASAIKPWQYASTCHTCRRPFGLFSSRHHCRNCGHSVCGAHSKYKAPLPHLQGLQRVCNSCHMALSASKPNEHAVVRRRVPSHRLRSQSAALRQYPWETPRETSQVFQWDHESLVDPVASLKQRRRTPTENTTINSSVARSSNASTALQQSMQYYCTPHAAHPRSAPNADSPTGSHGGESDGGSDLHWRISTQSETTRYTAQRNDPADTDAMDCTAQDSVSFSCKDSTASSDSMEFLSLSLVVPARRQPLPVATGEALQPYSDALDLNGLPDIVVLTMHKAALEAEVMRLRCQLADCRAAAAHELKARRRRHLRAKVRRGHIAAAQSFIDQGEFFCAQLEFKKALALDDSSAAIWHALAECLVQCHWPEEAALACQMSLELARTPGTVALLGRIRLRQRRLSDAIACFHEALE